ncbi:MAG: FAD-binding oxidoreductase [Rhodospirillaceae bacterium]|nr:FAD-binding oxidoreductase [Rhodospirillaceae bacterium]
MHMHRRAVLGGLSAAITVSYAFGPARAADLPAVTLDGADATLRDRDIQKFKSGFKGAVLQPTDADYDQARRIWNAMFEKRPALIAKCTSVDDVKTAVKFARDHNLLTAVRCGGHSISGQSVCERGLVIDLSGLRKLDLDVNAKTVRVDGGCLLGDVDKAAQSAGLASTFGVVSHTGVGGLTLGGGMGRLQRQFGLAIDNLLEVQVVTADGRLVTANKDENVDLYWGVRGGGGNFGIVTSFKFGLHDFNTPILGGTAIYPGAQAKQVLSNFFEYSATASDKLWLVAILSRNMKGDASAVISSNYMGSPSEGEPVLKAFTTFGNTIRTATSTTAYVDLQKQSDQTERHDRYHYAKSGMLGALAAPQQKALIDTAVDYFMENPMPGTRTLLLLMGGAVNRVDANATAYPHRNALHSIDVGGDGDTREDGEKYVQWGRKYWEGIEPFTGGGFYINSMIDANERRIQGNFGPNYDRLVAVKTKYDPTNLFRLNANVKPKAA